MDSWFREHGVVPPVARFPLVLVDGCTVQEPGSTTTTWRLHAQWDLPSKRFSGIELTDKHGAESLTRLRLQPGDVVLSDRNFAKPGPLQWVQDQKAYIISRVGWNALRWETLDGQPWDLLAAVRTLADGEVGSWTVQIRTAKDRPPLQLRLIARRKPPAAAEQSRRQARQEAKRHGHTPKAGTLEAADYLLVLTTLPETMATNEEILALYRLRWQIECAFKRLKSLIHIDYLRAFDPDLAQTYLLAKILGALLADTIRTHGAAVPSGDSPSSLVSSAPWRYTQMIWSDLCTIIRGGVDLTEWLTRTRRRWARHLHERPRKRQLQYDRGP